MTQTAPQEAQKVEGPRTYQSAWQFGENDAAVLLTAEDWLEEEAEVTATMESDDDPDDRPSRAGILRAIAKEVAALRAERSMWADSHTALVADAMAYRKSLPSAAQVTRCRCGVMLHSGDTLCGRCDP